MLQKMTNLSSDNPISAIIFMTIHVHGTPFSLRTAILATLRKKGINVLF